MLGLEAFQKATEAVTSWEAAAFWLNIGGAYVQPAQMNVYAFLICCKIKLFVC